MLRTMKNRRAVALFLLTTLCVAATASFGQARPRIQTLYKFGEKAGDFNQPGGLTLGADGNFYGVNNTGDQANGTGFQTAPYGLIFKMTPSGAVTILHAFSGGEDGLHPQSPLVLADDGFFYGTTGGDCGVNCANAVARQVSAGTVFKMSPAGQLSTIYTFTNGADGGSPSGKLVQGTDAALYGTTVFGGSNNGGTVFKVSTAGVLTTLYTIPVAEGNSIDPLGLIAGSDGNSTAPPIGAGTSILGRSIRSPPKVRSRQSIPS